MTPRYRTAFFGTSGFVTAAAPPAPENVVAGTSWKSGQTVRSRGKVASRDPRAREIPIRQDSEAA